jgi:hypothetical protein
MTQLLNVRDISENGREKPSKKSLLHKSMGENYQKLTETKIFRTLKIKGLQ